MKKSCSWAGMSRKEKRCKRERVDAAEEFPSILYIKSRLMDFITCFI
jgi:hypothetical protein